MNKLEPIVTDTYDFPTLIRRGYVYVGKTKFLHRLISGALKNGGYYIISDENKV